MNKCKDCQSEFGITSDEKKFYESKGFALPLRCKKCRTLRKEQKARGEDRNYYDNRRSYVNSR